MEQEERLQRSSSVHTQRADSGHTLARAAVSMPTFAQEAQVDVILSKIKAHLQSQGSLMQAFHHIDKDRSQSLSADEFVACLKECGVTLPQHMLGALVARFDANGDNTISIPEFQAFMAGDKDKMDMLREAPTVVPEPTPSPKSRQPNYSASAGLRLPRESAPRNDAELTERDLLFLARMDGDIDARRKTAFISELSTRART